MEKMKPKYVKICPKCRSLNVGMRWQSMWFFGMPASFRCMDCGFTGYVFPEIDVRKIKKGKKLK